MSNATSIAPSQREPVADEPNLLPDWYPQLMRRRNWLRLQMAVSLLLLMGLVLSLVAWRGNEEVTAWRLRDLDARRQATARELVTLQNEEERLATLMRRAEFIEEIGLPVEVTRVLAEIDKAATDSTAITSIRVAQNQRRSSALDVTPTSLLLRFELRGVAARYEDVKQLHGTISRNSLFQSVRLGRISNTMLNDMAGVEFDLTFAIELLLEDVGRASA
ncbi:MAG: PilN domain-containing protein [Planctomycetota bacterium]